MPRKKIACASCGQPMQPGPRSLPEGVATHKTCPSVGDPLPPPVRPRPATPVFESPGDGAMVSRRDELEWMRAELRRSIREADAGRRAPLVRELRLVVDELAALGAEEAKGASPDGVIDIQSLIAARLAAAAGQGDAASGADAR